jgi:hypothetical protein
MVLPVAELSVGMHEGYFLTLHYRRAIIFAFVKSSTPGREFVKNVWENFRKMR